MKRFDINIRAFQSALEQRPEILKAVRVNKAFCVALHMVNDAPVIILVQIVVGHEGIGADRSALLNVRANVGAKLGALGSLNHLGYDLRGFVAFCPLQDALDGSLSYTGIANLRAAIFVHVTGLSADVGLICFTNPVHLATPKPVLHREPDAVKHEPSCFLSNAERPRQFARANAVLCVHDQPSSRQPLVQAQRRIFKDRSDLHAELLFASATIPDAAGKHQIADLSRTATGARNTLGPTHLSQKIVTSFRVGKVADCAGQRLGNLVGFRAHE